MIILSWVIPALFIRISTCCHFSSVCETIFENDSKNLLTNVENFDIIFTSVDGNHPKLVRAFLGKKISLETLVVFEKLLHYRKRFNKEIKEQIIWP